MSLLGSAKQMYEQALHLEAGNTEALINLAQVLEKEGDYHQAVAHYQQAIRLHPQAVAPHFRPATLYDRHDMFDEAEKEYQGGPERRSSAYQRPQTGKSLYPARAGGKGHRAFPAFAASGIAGLRGSRSVHRPALQTREIEGPLPSLKPVRRPTAIPRQGRSLSPPFCYKNLPGPSNPPVRSSGTYDLLHESE